MPNFLWNTSTVLPTAEEIIKITNRILDQDRDRVTIAFYRIQALYNSGKLDQALADGVELLKIFYSPPQTKSQKEQFFLLLNDTASLQSKMLAQVGRSGEAISNA